MIKSEMKQMALAIMYGDAYVDTNTVSGKSRLDIYHCSKQKEWLDKKEEYLSNINGIKIHTREKADNRKLLSGGTREGWRLTTGFLRYFYSLSVSPEKYKVKQLVKPLSLSILWQDDGTLCWDSKGNYSTGYLCTDSWDISFIKLFLKEFNKLYGWQPMLMLYRCRGKEYYRLRFRKNEAIKLSNIIKSYVVPCMKHKIIS